MKQNNYYIVKKIQPWFYTIHDPIGVFCYLIVGREKALLFDTAHGIAPLDDVIRSITALPYEVVLSHGHWDHTAGAYQFDTVWLHPADFEICQRHFNSQTRQNIMNWYQDVITTAAPDFNAATYLTIDQKQSPTLRALSANQRFDLGGLTVVMVPMEGHTPGSVGAFIEEHGFLLVGDATNAHCWMFLEDSLTIRTYVEMLKKLQQLPFKWFLMSHAEKQFPYADIQKYITVAENIDIKKATPYEYKFDSLGGYLYEEDGVGIVFNPRKLS